MGLKQRVTALEGRTAGEDPEWAWIRQLTDEELNAHLSQQLTELEAAGDLLLTEHGFIVPEGTESSDLVEQLAEILNRGLARMAGAQATVTEP